MENVNAIYLLAIESAISGGSIALFQGNDLVAGSCGRKSVSRAEDLLPNIVSLLDESGIGRHELSRIAISLGPGSYTGLRIGIATVMGLSRGLGLDHVGVPLVDAISKHYSEGPSLVALPMGRSDICIGDAESGINRVISMDDLKREIEQGDASRLLAHADLIPALTGVPSVIDIGSNLARFVAAAAVSLPESPTLEPIYIQNPRFGNALPT